MGAIAHRACANWSPPEFLRYGPPMKIKDGAGQTEWSRAEAGAPSGSESTADVAKKPASRRRGSAAADSGRTRVRHTPEQNVRATREDNSLNRRLALHALHASTAGLTREEKEAFYDHRRYRDHPSELDAALLL